MVESNILPKEATVYTNEHERIVKDELLAQLNNKLIPLLAVINERWNHEVKDEGLPEDAKPKLNFDVPIFDLTNALQLMDFKGEEHKNLTSLFIRFIAKHEECSEEDLESLSQAELKSWVGRLFPLELRKTVEDLMKLFDAGHSELIDQWLSTPLEGGDRTVIEVIEDALEIAASLEPEGLTKSSSERKKTVTEDLRKKKAEIASGGKKALETRIQRLDLVYQLVTRLAFGVNEKARVLKRGDLKSLIEDSKLVDRAGKELVRQVEEVTDGQEKAVDELLSMEAQVTTFWEVEQRIREDIKEETVAQRTELGENRQRLWAELRSVVERLEGNAERERHMVVKEIEAEKRLEEAKAFRDTAVERLKEMKKQHGQTREFFVQEQDRCKALTDICSQQLHTIVAESTEHCKVLRENLLRDQAECVALQSESGREEVNIRHENKVILDRIDKRTRELEQDYVEMEEEGDPEELFEKDLNAQGEVVVVTGLERIKQKIEAQKKYRHRRETERAAVQKKSSEIRKVGEIVLRTCKETLESSSTASAPAAAAAAAAELPQYDEGIPVSDRNINLIPITETAETMEQITQKAVQRVSEFFATVPKDLPSSCVYVHDVGSTPDVYTECSETLCGSQCGDDERPPSAGDGRNVSPSLRELYAPHMEMSWQLPELNASIRFQKERQLAEGEATRQAAQEAVASAVAAAAAGSATASAAAVRPEGQGEEALPLLTVGGEDEDEEVLQ